MLVSKKLFTQVGGFDERYKINYSDIDFCLKIRSAGYRVVYTPHAALYHFESVSRFATVAPEEKALYLSRWREITQHDPYYNQQTLKDCPPNFEAVFE